ncbi:hypothetical protein N7466_006468 [Penicillium verhagenii]|uniref:uncharacterized protein n=1 Tax=Penicillium verhagenii TaxID=1562060 RepID=UPI002544D56D|nr:uncharacterized protein N7466_006468 [Penicillium verhagenii]KAJ5930975.1 hypothetical protein N7466_006468 [Penicillium verhagenii]
MTTQTPPLPFRLIPATEDDCPTLARIEATALASTKNEPVNVLWYTTFGPPTEEGIAYRAQNFSDALKSSPSNKIWKAVIADPDSPTGEKIVGFSLWCFYTEPEYMPEWKGMEWPSTANAVASNELIGELNALKKRHMDGKCYGLLRVLCTLPEYRGLGVASALIQLGLDEGVKEGLKLFWLHGSADGQALYRKFGFVDVEALESDVSKYGGVGKTNVIGMRKVVE